MQILSHRGYWLNRSEQNTVSAFRRSFENGFGTETDLRDQNGRIVISHDPPGSECMDLDLLLELHAAVSPTIPLALNIKSDGLQNLLLSALQRRPVASYFAFDMSVPDMLGYLRAGVPVFARQSEFERNPVLLNRASGIWLDSVESDWFDSGILEPHFMAGLPVCIVSPELHGRDPIPLWTTMREWGLGQEPLAKLCTDRPVEADRFFGSVV